jgi:hypothetical protein
MTKPLFPFTGYQYAYEEAVGVWVQNLAWSVLLKTFALES